MKFGELTEIKLPPGNRGSWKPLFAIRQCFARKTHHTRGFTRRGGWPIRIATAESVSFSYCGVMRSLGFEQIGALGDVIWCVLLREHTKETHLAFGDPAVLVTAIYCYGFGPFQELL